MVCQQLGEEPDIGVMVGGAHTFGHAYTKIKKGYRTGLNPLREVTGRQTKLTIS